MIAAASFQRCAKKITCMDARAPDFTTEFGANAPFVADLFSRWSEDPATVSEDWRDYFSRVARGDGRAAEPVEARPEIPNGRPAPDGQPPAAEQSPPPQPGPEPIRGIAARIVRNMEESLEIPTATSVRTISVKILEENRNVLNRHHAVAG